MVVLVTKADGTQEPFAKEKLLASLRRTGADEVLAEDIAEDVERTLTSGVTTSEIYRKAFTSLREHKRGVAARYSLKRAVLDLGPSGFPFETYLAELFRREGYECQIDQIVKGACVEHEVDVIARKGKEVTYIEAKFHNTAGFKTDLKTMLYVKARMDDIRSSHGATEVVRGMVATNTKFTTFAQEYASCQKMELLGWDVPEGHSLHDRIEKTGLYPITALTTLTKNEKMALLSQRLVLCNKLSMHEPALAEAGVRGKKAELVLEEAGALCKIG